MNEVLVSIILPVFNGETYLSNSIESCLNQSHKNIELIIVNDCSTDRTLEIIEGYALIDNRVRIINNKINLKLPKSLNIGHSQARGCYITWTSHDNQYTQVAIEKMLFEINSNSVDIVYGNMTLIDHLDQHLSYIETAPIENIIFNNPIGGCFLYSRNVYEKLGGYDESLFLVEDYDFWLRSTIHFNFFHLAENLYFFRHHENSLSSSRTRVHAMRTLFYQNLERMFSNFLKTISCRNNRQVAVLLTDNIVNKKSDFTEIKLNFSELNKTILCMMKLKAFSRKKGLKEYFMRYIIRKLWEDAWENGFKLSSAIFVIYKFNFFLGKNQINSLTVFFLSKFKLYTPK